MLALVFGLLGLLTPNLEAGAVLSRRAVLTGVGAAPVLGGLLPAGAAVNEADVKLLVVQAKKLRAQVRSGAGNRRLLPLDPTKGVNNYASLTDTVTRAKTSVLLPLLVLTSSDIFPATPISVSCCRPHVHLLQTTSTVHIRRR